MPPTIVGTLPAAQSVDANGSLSIDIPLQVPPAKMAPKLSLAYHSASTGASTVGLAWVLRGASMIERVEATKAQDGFRGVVNYDNNDRFALDGQRLIFVGGAEYRFEMERWSKIIAQGDPHNPTSWTEYLPDGSTRLFGTTPDSNILAVGQSATRVWAVSEYSDPFTNYMSYQYTNDTPNGSFYLNSIAYGGNRNLRLAHQREITLQYEPRLDISTKYIGGSKIRIDKRLKSLTSLVRNQLVHTHLLGYDAAPLTGVTRVKSLTLVDASSASVRPLVFDWVNGSPSVFEAPGMPSTIDFQGSNVDMFPVDVHATGRSDVVVASKVTTAGLARTRVAIHPTDSTGRISSQASSVHADLPYHTALFPLDVSGDGKTDMIHISLGGNSFTITVLLSTDSGFQAQPSLQFTPASTGGFFRCGDFEGNGRVGLIYIYKSGGSNVKFVQFTSDGMGFTAKALVDGPTGIAFDDMSVVVGDLNGNGEEDVFLLSPKLKNGVRCCYISFLESVNGTLQYRPHDGLVQAGESIVWTDTTAFFPYSIDEDGKTSMLVASKRTSNSHLVLQVLRSTGRTLLPSSAPLETTLRYDGNLTVARTSSTNGLDIINTFVRTGASPGVDIHMLKYRDGSFDVVDGVRQGPAYKAVTWGDFRGIGRSDLLLNTQVPGKFNICPMRCVSSQPVDYISGYATGMGARIDVTYAPLSDDSTYDADSDVSNFPLAASNAMARNISSTANLSSSKVSEMSHSRSEIVYFPSWVVKEVVSTPCAAKPTVQEKTGYLYRNARFGFDGRGWLGFEKITKTLAVMGTAETTWYRQDFPFLAQVDRTEMKTKGGQLLQTRAYAWNDVLTPGIGSHSVRMSQLNEVHYEGGALAYTVNAAYQYDPYANLSELVIVSPEVGTSALTITSTFANSIASAWVIGNKTREIIKQSGSVLKDTQITYLSGTQSPSETKNWVNGGEWSTQTLEYDTAGNETAVGGPGPARRELLYDDTYSTVTSSKTLVSAKEHGKALSFTDPNGRKTSFTYDVLGRLHETYNEDPSTQKTLVKTESFAFENGQFKHVEKSRTAWDKEQWLETVEYIDGQGQVWLTERPKPDGLPGLIRRDTEYDGAGRTTAVSQEYFTGTTPSFHRYIYDERSRIIQESIPPSSTALPSTPVLSRYTFSAGLEECIETSTSGATTKTVSRKTRYLPNAEKPAVDNLVKPYVVVSRNELDQQVETSFDGLGRPVLVKDPNDALLALTWDGLSRLCDRRLSHKVNNNSTDIHHTSVTFDDEHCRTTVQNVLTGTTTVATYDFCKRLLSMVSLEERITYTYDIGGTFAKGRLMSVVSDSSGLVHHYDYDIHGQLVKNNVTVDGYIYATSYEWSPLGQLLKIVNPDGSTINRLLCPDGESVSRVELADAANAVKATIALSRYEDVFGRPLMCEFGNGLSASSAMHLNGALSNITLLKGVQAVHRQDWKIGAFDRINGYERDHNGDKSGSVLFQYDASGQLTESLSSDPENLNPTPDEYTYDSSGNLSTKNGKTFVNQGWQLSSVKNSNGSTEYSFTYSSDGNMLAKLDSLGNTTRSMRYDSQGRLVQLDNTHMVYDFGGRLVKCVRPNGDITIYPSQTCDIDINASSRKKTYTSYLVHGYRRASLAHEEGSTSSATVQYYHNDHLGSTVAVSDSLGSIITEYKYDAFGKVVVEGSDIARYKFSGKELFVDVYYFGARFYDPSIGRFLTLDNYPVDLEDISPCTFNMYAFSRNNPINFIDLNGNAPWWHWLIDAILIVVAVVLMFIPVVGEIATVAMGAAIGGFMGAGMAGLNADIGGASDKEWGIQLGIGAVIGAISGGATTAVDVALPTATFTLKSASGFAKWAGKSLLKVGINKGLGVIAQVVDNAAHGRSAGEGLENNIPGMGSGDTDWKKYIELGATTGLSLVAGQAKSSMIKSRLEGKYSLGGPKPGKLAQFKDKITGTKRYEPEYPLRQTGLEVGKYRQTGSMRYLGMTETTRL
ncbi:hypothetical protein BDZ89DRAFT_1116604 [Hymenopellis radicata]|nr:hypothetical protein BDZ89DRAFT_1116604 [Hymenopellis radicata]